MTRPLSALFALASLLAAPPLAAAGSDTPAADTLAAQTLAAMPACTEAAARCFRLRLHVAEDGEGAPVVDAAWLGAQVTHANTVFADVGVGFEVTAVSSAGPDVRRVLTREDRDRLGRASHDARFVDVWVVGQLANVDDPGDIRGVHWRDRAARAHRWIILSAIAPVPVLAHELGHYFGVPHSAAAGSLMNKSGNDPTPFAERRFVAAEQRRIRRSAKRFAAERAPVDTRAGRGKSR